MKWLKLREMGQKSRNGSVGINDENFTEMACEMTSDIDRELDIAMVAALYFCAPNSCICNSFLGLGKLARGARRPSLSCDKLIE